MGFNITIAGTAPVTMSSREIADLVEKRHDNVKRAVDMLVDRGVVAIPQIESVAEAATTPTGGRRTYTTTVYRLDKRSSLIVVAQLSPEFTARVVDRWQELEERANCRPQIRLWPADTEEWMVKMKDAKRVCGTCACLTRAMGRNYCGATDTCPGSRDTCSLWEPIRRENDGK